jgi:hypothetical protein
VDGGLAARADLAIARGRRANERDAWGTLELKRVDSDGAVVIEFGGELRARPGEVFPWTGVRVIASNAGLGTALLRTRWIHTQEGQRPAP